MLKKINLFSGRHFIFRNLSTSSTFTTAIRKQKKKKKRKPHIPKPNPAICPGFSTPPPPACLRHYHWYHLFSTCSVLGPALSTLYAPSSCSRSPRRCSVSSPFNRKESKAQLRAPGAPIPPGKRLIPISGLARAPKSSAGPLTPAAQQSQRRPREPRASNR